MITVEYELERFCEEGFHIETLALRLEGEVWPATEPSRYDPGEGAGAHVYRAICRNTGEDLLGMLDAHLEELERALMEGAGL